MSPSWAQARYYVDRIPSALSGQNLEAGQYLTFGLLSRHVQDFSVPTSVSYDFKCPLVGERSPES